ncbi:hypothetical protein FRC02_003962 [Tulasnella sp. 418]|nr:hypothetical protein FRC02_003962 [Tulasnella sp. 418]
MGLHDFYDAFGRELSDVDSGNPFYSAYCEKRGIECTRLPTAEMKVDGRELFGRMMRSSTYDPLVVEAIRRIRETGQWNVIALTNNFSIPYEAILASPPTATFSPEKELEFLGWANNGGPGNPALRAMFDDFIDSSAVGKRQGLICVLKSKY